MILSIPIAVLSLKARIPHMDFSFGLEGSDRFDLQVWKVLLQGNDLTPYLNFFGQDAGNPKGSTTSSARQDLAMIGTDEVGNGSYFWWTHRRRILCHTRPARLAQKAWCW